MMNQSKISTSKEKISLTDSAAVFLKSDFASKGLFGYAVRIGVEKHGGSCSEYKYRLDYVNEAYQSDKFFMDKGVSIICDAASYPLLRGITLDHDENGPAGGIQMINPNAGRSCGCGSGFSKS